MKMIQNPEIGEIKVLKRGISNFSVVLEKGDQVQIVGMGERGYDLIETVSGTKVVECGWDLFES